jgi:hypothetical protein
MARKKKSVDEYVLDAIVNIEKDRQITTELLQDVMGYIGKDSSNHASVGHVAAKYVESLQRSNEQLVKLTAIMLKREGGTYGDLDDDEKKNLYDTISEETK